MPPMFHCTTSISRTRMERWARLSSAPRGALVRAISNPAFDALCGAPYCHAVDLWCVLWQPVDQARLAPPHAYSRHYVLTRPTVAGDRAQRAEGQVRVLRVQVDGRPGHAARQHCKSFKYLTYCKSHLFTPRRHMRREHNSTPTASSRARSTSSSAGLAPSGSQSPSSTR